MRFPGIELLAGTHHPHATEVQNFACYGRAIDARTREEFRTTTPRVPCLRHYRDFSEVGRTDTDQELRLLLVDPKGTELAPFSGSGHLQAPIGWDEADALVLVEMAVSEMQRRYVLFKAASQRSLAEYNATGELDERLPWWVIVLDEYADLTHDPQAKRDIEVGLKRLAQRARAAGIHVTIATQKPSTNLRSNLPAQLALRLKSATESRVVIDEAGAENLNGKDDGLLKSDGKLQRVQCSRVDAHSQGVALGGPRP